MAKVLIFLIFACFPSGNTGSWHTLVPNGPIAYYTTLRSAKPPEPAHPGTLSQLIVQHQAVPLQSPSHQQFGQQLKSSAVTQENQSVTSTVNWHPQSTRDQLQITSPQYPAAAGIPPPYPPQQTLFTRNALFTIPAWIMNLAKMAAGLSAALSSLGLAGMPDISVCGNAPLLKETMICIQNALEEVKSIFLTGKEIVTLNARVLAGGRTADTALQRLKTLSSKPYAKLLMKILGTTIVAQMLMQRESTPDRQRWQAGSVITLVTDIPVATVIADSQTGSFGHINVVLPRPSRVRQPDRLIKLLDEGVDPINFSVGPMTDLEGRDDIDSLAHMV